jgi:inorganic triphosphatase YgiF
MANIEEEVALIIRSFDPKAVADKVASLDKVGIFKLVAQPDLFLTDTYYDTFAGAIRGAKSSLRIRRVDDGKKLTTLVTVKGGNFSTGDGSKRVEHEFEWPFAEVEPEQVFNLFELKPTQVRENYRRPRLVFDPTLKKPKEPMAELVIDDLNYKFKDGKTARLYELEIELKSKDVDADIDEVAQALRTKFPNLLRPWKHSKLSMGKLIEVALDIKTDKDGLLNDKAFDAIGRIL